MRSFLSTLPQKLFFFPFKSRLILPKYVLSVGYSGSVFPDA